MADINKFTTKEVLNKVLLDSSGDAVAAYSHTSQEALNAVLDSANSRLNVSLVGGTISGDVTISGDLTVEGGGSLSYDEIIEGSLNVDGEIQQTKIRIYNSSNVGYIDHSGDFGGGAFFIRQLGSNHDMRFQTNKGGATTTALAIDGLTHNIGIGTESPSNKLHIYDGTYSLLFDGNEINHSNNNSTFYIKSGGSIYLQPNATTRFVLDDNSRISLSNNDGGNTSNTIFGKSAFNQGGDVGADYNSFFGEGVAGTGTLSTATGNVGMGWVALQDLTSGSDNVVLGAAAGHEITTGNENIIIGSNAGGTMTTQDEMVLIGHNVGDAINNDTADGTVAIGHSALTALTSGARNMAIGYESGKLISTQDDNTFVGYQSGRSATGTGNVALGKYTMYEGVGADNNTAIGANALKNVTGDENTAVGSNSLDALVAGTRNTTLGYNSASALGAAETGNISIGWNSMSTMDEGSGGTINYNIALGVQALSGADLGSGTEDISHNIAIGTDSLRLVSGDAQTGTIAIGRQALTALTTGARNTAVGYTAGAEEVAGNDNTVIGYEALHDGGGLANSSNTIIGSQAGDGTWVNNACNYNTAVGQGTMRGAMDGAAHNVAVGFVSGTAITSGQRNTFIGGGSGSACTTGDKNVAVGNDANVAAAVDEQIAIGYSTTVTAQYGIAIGHDITAGTNDAVIGKSGAIITVDFDADGTWAQSSDIRKKKNIKDDLLGLEFINDLKTKTFQWRPAEEHPEEWEHFKIDKDGNKIYADINTDVVMHGMIAQEVKESMDKVECDTFGGWKENSNGQQEISKASFVIPLIKAVQELSAKVEELEAKLSK